MEFLGKLGIDWKILISQIINFLVLLWLLKILLYKPLLKNLKERQEKAREIERKEKEIERKKREIEKQSEEIILKATERAKKIIEEGKGVSEKEKERIIRRTREEMGEILKEAKERAEMEVKKIEEKEEREILKKAGAITKEVLSESLSLSLQKRYLEEIIEKIKKIDFEKLKEREITSITLISAYPLSKKETKEISDFFFAKLKNLVFQEKIDPDLIAGVKIIIDGFLIDASLKKKIEEIVSQK